MSLETSLQTLLNPLASGGAFQDVAGQSPVAPYIVWQQVVSTTNNNMLGASNMQNTRLQIDIYAPTGTQRSTIEAAVISAMAAASFTNVQISSQSMYEPETRLYRRMLEFSVWSA